MTDVATKTDTTTAVKTVCPDCGSKAKRVSAVTLRALLKEDVAGQIAGADSHSCCETTGSGAAGCQPVAEDTAWRFCDSPGCDVVYFSEPDDTTFTRSQLRVDVGIKDAAGERSLCYCFGHSVESMKSELRTSGSSGALADIRAKMKDPGCRCETENPSGSCCLGSVARGLKVAQLEIGVSDDELPPASIDGDSNKSMTGRGEKIATAGTLISAFMASSCCWLPLLLLALGVSGAGVASTLEAYRPLFIVVTFGFLGAAFYFTYRPKMDTAGNSADCCAPQAATQDCCAPDAAASDCCAPETAAATDCCTPPSGQRFSIMALNKAMLWGVTVMAVAFLFFPGYVGAFLGGDGKTVTEDMNRAVIQLDGMTCETCAANVINAVRKVPGVLAVEVDYAKSEAVVGSEFCCPIPKEQILTAIKNAGFSATVIRELPSRLTTGSVRPAERPAFAKITPSLHELPSDASEFRQMFKWEPQKPSDTSTAEVRLSSSRWMASDASICRQCSIFNQPLSGKFNDLQQSSTGRLLEQIQTGECMIGRCVNNAR